VSGQALAQIAGTKHNLGSTGTGQNKVTDTAEVCVFCHTPHASNTLMTSAPLWNKNVTSTTYQVYDTNVSSTIDGRVLQPGAGTGSVSVACLSCHDGAQAMDNIINAPGSGGYNALGVDSGIDPSIGRNYSWVAGGRVDADGRLTNGGGFIANLSTDLRNDHPVGIQYCGGGQSSSAATGACVDPDFVAPSNGVINGAQVWWVDTSVGTTGRQKTDMILYTRDFSSVSSGPTAAPSVECASCHDPHISNGTTFLRIANTGSAVCLACHTK